MGKRKSNRNGRRRKRRSSPRTVRPQVVDLYGFVRDDVALERSSMPSATWRWLRGDVHPQVGLWVALQVVAPALRNVDGGHGWCMMSGAVTQVVSSTEVRFVAAATTNNAPSELTELPWAGTLLLLPDVEHPWVLDAMQPCTEATFDGGVSDLIGEGRFGACGAVMPLVSAAAETLDAARSSQQGR